MSQGINLAVKHIAAAGGPNIQVLYKDHKSGNAQAGVQATTELGTAHVPACLASYSGDLGVMYNGLAQYKIFTMDGGGGTSTFGQDKPYFWGTRAITPNDAIPGLFEYTKRTFPSLKTVGVSGWDVGEPGNSIEKCRWPDSPTGAGSVRRTRLTAAIAAVVAYGPGCDRHRGVRRYLVPIRSCRSPFDGAPERSART